MADEAKGIPTWAWVVIGLAVLWFLSKKITGAASQAAKGAGYGAGRGAVDAAFDKATSPGALSALGSFVGGLFGGHKEGAGPGGQSAAFTDDTNLGDFDTGNYTVSDGFSFTDASGNFIAG